MFELPGPSSRWRGRRSSPDHRCPRPHPGRRRSRGCLRPPGSRRPFGVVRVLGPHRGCPRRPRRRWPLDVVLEVDGSGRSSPERVPPHRSTRSGGTRQGSPSLEGALGIEASSRGPLSVSTLGNLQLPPEHRRRGGSQGSGNWPPSSLDRRYPILMHSTPLAGSCHQWLAFSPTVRFESRFVVLDRGM